MKFPISKQGTRVFSALLILVLLSAGIACADEAPQEAAGGSLARIIAADDGLFITDVNGSTWAMGSGGPMLGIPNISNNLQVKTPTLIALKNVVDVQGYKWLNAFLTAQGEVWLAGTPDLLAYEWESHPEKAQRDLRRLDVEDVREIYMTATGSIGGEERLIMRKKDGSYWAYGCKSGLFELKMESDIAGFYKGAYSGTTIYLTRENGAISSYRWNDRALKLEKERFIPEGYTPLESGFSFARHTDGTLYRLSNINRYEKITAPRAEYRKGLPREDTDQLRRLYMSAALYADGEAWVWAQAKWQKLPGRYTDIAYTSHSGILLTDTDGNVSWVEGDQYGYNQFKSAAVKKTSVNLYRAVPERKTPKLPGEEYRLPNGAVRAASDPKPFSSATLYSKYKAKKRNGLPFYKPAVPQPLNVLITTADGHAKWCNEKSDNLDEWAADIVKTSQGMLRVVTDPKKAEVMIAIRRKYSKVAYRTKRGKKVNVYNCAMTITAVMLTDPGLKASLSEKSVAPDSFKVSSVATAHYEPDPFFHNLSSLTDKILSWYGLGCKKGTKGAGAKRVQQALKTRQFYSGKIDGTFSDRSVEALKRFQTSIGCEPTGAVDRNTLTWLYYD